jgi:hypothetical protein
MAARVTRAAASSASLPTAMILTCDQPSIRYRQVPFRGRFARDVPLPPDARATGYHHGPYALWVSPSDADRHRESLPCPVNDAVKVLTCHTGAYLDDRLPGLHCLSKTTLAFRLPPGHGSGG